MELLLDDIVDYMDVDVQQGIYELLQHGQVNNCTMVFQCKSTQKSDMVHTAVSWLSDFVALNRSTEYVCICACLYRSLLQVNNTFRYLVDRSTFVPVLRLIFLREQRYAPYASDIAFDASNKHVIATRMYLVLTERGTRYM